VHKRHCGCVHSRVRIWRGLHCISESETPDGNARRYWRGATETPAQPNSSPTFIECRRLPHSMTSASLYARVAGIVPPQVAGTPRSVGRRPVRSILLDARFRVEQAFSRSSAGLDTATSTTSSAVRGWAQNSASVPHHGDVGSSSSPATSGDLRAGPGPTAARWEAGRRPFGDGRAGSLDSFSMTMPRMSSVRRPRSLNSSSADAGDAQHRNALTDFRQFRIAGIPRSIAP
jgi:hypothetical protein